MVSQQVLRRTAAPEIKYEVFVSAQIEELQLTCQIGSVNCADKTEIAVKRPGSLSFTLKSIRNSEPSEISKTNVRSDDCSP